MGVDRRGRLDCSCNVFAHSHSVQLPNLCSDPFRSSCPVPPPPLPILPLAP